MAWETRGGGSSYYYRSRWVNGQVRKEYVGTRYVAELAARLDKLKCAEREAEAQAHEVEREKLQEATTFLGELEEATEVLVRAHLLAGGLKCRRGEWRRPRESS
jgi:hypothetical protein